MTGVTCVKTHRARALSYQAVSRDSSSPEADFDGDTVQVCSLFTSPSFVADSLFIPALL